MAEQSNGWSIPHLLAVLESRDREIEQAKRDFYALGRHDGYQAGYAAAEQAEHDRWGQFAARVRQVAREAAAVIDIAGARRARDGRAA